MTELRAILEDLERDMSSMLPVLRRLRVGVVTPEELSRLGLEFIVLLGEVRRAKGLLNGSGEARRAAVRPGLDGKSLAAGEGTLREVEA